MPYIICKDFHFAAAHSIPDHPGKCARLHGHNYRLRVFLAAEQLDRLGMVMDFADLKAHLEAIAGGFDHQVIDEIPPFDQLNSTAELLAEHFYRQLKARLSSDRVAVRRVEVWENDSSCAIFEP